MIGLGRRAFLRAAIAATAAPLTIARAAERADPRAAQNAEPKG
jgi:hypothetical protein